MIMDRKVTVRLSEQDYQQLKAVAGQGNMSDTIRQTLSARL